MVSDGEFKRPDYDIVVITRRRRRSVGCVPRDLRTTDSDKHKTKQYQKMFFIPIIIRTRMEIPLVKPDSKRVIQCNQQILKWVPHTHAV